MAGISHKTPIEAWQWVMDIAGWNNTTEMARATNLPDSTCRDFVYEGKVPSLDRAFIIAKAARIDLDELAKRIAASV